MFSPVVFKGTQPLEKKCLFVQGTRANVGLSNSELENPIWVGSGSQQKALLETWACVFDGYSF